jgi:hypothetical protein
MKILLTLIGIGMVIQYETQGQATDVIRVKGGLNAEKTIPIADRYRYDQFRDGKVLFMNGTSAAARFNYNSLLGEMQFIDARGDTLAVADDPIVRLVGVGPDLFLYDPAKGYLEAIADYGIVKLGVKRYIKMAKNEKQGGYDQSSGVSAITNYQFYSSGNTSVNKLAAKGDLVLIKDKSYYIIDQNNRFYPINRANLLKVFGKHREQVSAYLTNESIDFKREDDLRKLLKYCSELL